MNIKHHTEPDQLERYSFWWSEARLFVAALALLLGGVPPLLAFNPFPELAGTLNGLLHLAWIVSGAASAYLLYRWNAGGQKVFGGRESKDAWAFFIAVVSGFNLGLAGLLNINIGMAISSNRGVFALVALIYVVTAVYLYKRFKSHGEKVF